MKTSTFILCFVLICFKGNSQIIDSLNSWNYLQVLIPVCEKNTECSGIYYTNMHFAFGHDTVVNSKNYKIVIESEIKDQDTVANYIAGFLRDEENHKKVYFHSNNMYDTSEVLLYDFTIKIDSVFTVFHNNLFFFSAKVMDIDSVEQFGVKRLRIKFFDYFTVFNQDNDIEDTTAWIEGIGSNQSLLYQDYGTSLLCFKHNNETQFSTDYGYDCDFSGPDVYVKTQDSKDLVIYPNPLQDGLLTIQSSIPMNTIAIYSISGIKLGEYFPNNTSYQLELSSLKSGVYILSIDNEYRKIIIE